MVPAEMTDGAPAPPPAKRVKTDDVEQEDAAVAPAPPAPVSVPQYTRESSAKEGEVGIVAHVQASLFRAKVTLKGRFSDFVVREVGTGGEVARLSDVTSVPAAFRDGNLSTDVPADGADALKEWACSAEEIAFVEALLAGLTPLEERRRQRLKEGTDEVVCAGATAEKPRRTEFHVIMKARYPALVSSVAPGQQQQLQVRNKTEADRQWEQKKWDKKYPDYLHFTLYKENLESQGALTYIQQALRLRQHSFCICGTKDKRAITAQRVSAYRLMPDKLLSLNGRNFGSGILKIGNITGASEGLRLGAHEGNRFSLVLRECAMPDGAEVTAEATEAFRKQVDATMGAVTEHGFINYFGLQRFGSTQVPTFRVAELIMKGSYADALHVVLSSKAEIVKEFAPSVEAWAAGDVAKAIELCPHFVRTEKSFLHRYRDNIEGGSDRDQAARSAFEIVFPRNTRSLYFHALQAVVWNEMATVRVSNFPHKPIAGDLVLLPESDEPRGRGKGYMPAVKTLTEEEAASGTYSMEDVVLPLPGCDTALAFPTAAGIDRAAVCAVLERHGGAELVVPFDGKQHAGRTFDPKDINTFGGYRPVMRKPGNLAWSVTRYEDKEADLQFTEYDREKSSCELAEDRPVAGFADPAPSNEGSRVAVRCSFTLQQSVYATVFLREVFDVTTAAL